MRYCSIIAGLLESSGGLIKKKFINLNIFSDG